MLCCESGSAIRWLFDLWIQDPGWVKNQDTGSVIRIRDEYFIVDHISDSVETIFGLKYFNSLMHIRDSYDPGFGIEIFGFGINPAALPSAPS
jgi:hypothetical protein